MRGESLGDGEVTIRAVRNYRLTKRTSWTRRPIDPQTDRRYAADRMAVNLIRVFARALTQPSVRFWKPDDNGAVSVLCAWAAGLRRSRKLRESRTRHSCVVLTA